MAEHTQEFNFSQGQVPFVVKVVVPVLTVRDWVVVLTAGSQERRRLPLRIALRKQAMTPELSG